MFLAGCIFSSLEDDLEHLNNYIRPSIGNIASLDSPLFSRERAELGLWTPFEFVEDGGAGIYFLEPWDPERVPVLFVHGINGSPRDFTALIEALDKERYQVWVLSYPTGLRLSWVARGMYQFLDVLRHQYEFDELHVVAHSMGGLVSRGAVNLCAQNRKCTYLASYTTISTPWSGVDSASNGVKWAPTVVPVWRDLDPGSEYVTTLFDTDLPEDLPYHLLFGYRHDTVFGAESSDGVIKLRSQLRHEAQANAVSIRGYDEGHTSILENEAVLATVFGILDENSGP
jgi:pimeloyl-ACP methyl ester carboxylesterase